MTPQPPRSHRVMAWHYAIKLYRLIGRPPITWRWRDTVTEMRPGPGDSVCVKTTKTIRTKEQHP